jgi:hypothetical protein
MRVETLSDPSLCLTCGVSTLLSPLTSLAGGAVHDAASAVLDTFISALNSTAGWMVNHVVALATSVTGPTQVDLGSKSWFGLQSSVMLQIAGLILAPLLLAATIGAIVRQDLRRLGRVWGVGLPVAVFAGVLATRLASLALTATDAMCSMVLSSTNGQVRAHLSVLTTSMLIPGAPQLVAAFISLLLIAGAVLLWLELVMRAAAIYVALWFVPLALAAYVWPATASMAKRAVELLVALIVSKFVIVATLTLGVGALSAGPSADNAVIGSAILLLSAFAPFCLLRLSPIVETAAIAHLEGVARRPLQAAGRVASAVAAGPAHPAARLLMAARAGGAKGAPPPAAPVAAQRLAERRPDYAGVAQGE